MQHQAKMSSSDLLTIICAEDISLLYLLHNVPYLPSSTQIERSRIREAGYTLSFDKERSIASTLAFLANTRGDPNHVPAICVHQINEHELQILVAVNKATWDDGRVDLRRTEQDFKTLFSVLSSTCAGK